MRSNRNGSHELSPPSEVFASLVKVTLIQNTV